MASQDLRSGNGHLPNQTASTSAFIGLLEGRKGKSPIGSLGGDAKTYWLRTSLADDETGGS